ncbi:MAG: ABC transporter permease [Planctomycetaceae bacterium]|nr:ABC transporter permease [Planctomycetaceae bacterium]
MNQLSETAQLSVSNETNSGSDSDQPDNEHWDLVIRPKRHLLDINFKELWDYRDLLFMFVKRDIVTVYKQTVLGPIWFFVQPIMTTLVYVIIFGNIAKISTDEIPKVLFYMSGIVMWNYFADSFGKTSTTFTSNASIFGKVYFPRLIVPLSVVTSGLIKFLIQFTLFLAVFAFYLITTDLIQPNWWILITPYLILLMAGLGLGFGIIFSSLTTKYRDLTFVIQFGVQLAMYATPIIYPMSLLSERAQAVLWWNPIAHLIETIKYGFLGTGQASVAGLAYTTAFTLVVLISGTIIFNRTEQTFMDTV